MRSHSIALSAPFHAPSRTHPVSFSFSLSLSVSPSWTLLVRFHPRPSTFRVYRTIARARITVTGRATSWLAVDVGGGRTADRRRRERRRRRRRRRGRAQQIVSETRRATKKKKSSVFSAISRSRYVLEKVRALCYNIRRVRRVESTSTSLEGILLECNSGGDLEDRSDTRNRERVRKRREKRRDRQGGAGDIDTILDFGVESPESTSVPLDLRAGPIA